MVVICDESSKKRDDTEDYEDETNPVLNNPNSHILQNGSLVYETLDFVNYTNLIVINMNDFSHFSKRILVFDRRNKSSVFRYYPLKVDKRQACNGCAVPTFVRKMDQKLFEKIQGMLSLGKPKKSDRNRYLVLFKIGERLQYCLTAESEVWPNFDIDFN